MLNVIGYSNFRVHTITFSLRQVITWNGPVTITRVSELKKNAIMKIVMNKKTAVRMFLASGKLQGQ